MRSGKGEVQCEVGGRPGRVSRQDEGLKQALSGWAVWVQIPALAMCLWATETRSLGFPTQGGRGKGPEGHACRAQGTGPGSPKERSNGGLSLTASEAGCTVCEPHPPRHSAAEVLREQTLPKTPREPRPTGRKPGRDGAAEGGSGPGPAGRAPPPPALSLAASLVVAPCSATGSRRAGGGRGLRDGSPTPA